MSAYDIVRQHTVLYVSIRWCTSACDVNRQHTMLYVSIRCRKTPPPARRLFTARAIRTCTCAAERMKLGQGGMEKGREGGRGREGVNLQSREWNCFCQTGTAIVLVDVTEGFKQNEAWGIAWTESRNGSWERVISEC
jgi:hypothetical protein